MFGCIRTYGTQGGLIRTLVCVTLDSTQAGEDLQKDPKVNRAHLENELWKTSTSSAEHTNIWKNECIVGNHMKE